MVHHHRLPNRDNTAAARAKARAEIDKCRIEVIQERKAVHGVIGVPVDEDACC